MPGGSLGSSAASGSATSPPGWLFPHGILGRGSAITAKPSQQDQPRGHLFSADPGRFDLLWSEWDWTGWWKPSIDQFKALGGNYLKIGGAPNGLPWGTNLYSVATYTSRISQVLTYLGNQGMFAVFCAGDRGMWQSSVQMGGQPQMTSTQWQQHISDIAPTLAQFQGVVVGVEMENEINSHVSDGGFANAAPQFTWTSVKADFVANRATIQAAAPWLPCTMSNSQAPGNASGGGGTTFINDMASIADYFDFHIYVGAGGVSAGFWNPVTSVSTKPLLVGEMGVNQTLASATRTAVIQSIRDNALNVPNCMGGSIWAVFDQADGTYPGSTTFNGQTYPQQEQWGLFDNPVSLTERTDVTGVFKTFRRCV